MKFIKKFSYIFIGTIIIGVLLMLSMIMRVTTDYNQYKYVDLENNIKTSLKKTDKFESFIVVLPNNKFSEATLFFESYEQNFQVNIDGKEIYRTFTNSIEEQSKTGYVLHMVELPENYVNKEITFNVYSKYGFDFDRALKFRKIMLNSNSNMSLYFVYKDFYLILVAFICLAFTLALLGVYFYMRCKHTQPLYLAAIALYYFLNTFFCSITYKFLFINSSLFWYYSYLSFYFLPVPICLFIYSVSEMIGREDIKKISSKFAGTSFVLGMIILLLDVFGITSMLKFETVQSVYLLVLIIVLYLLLIKKSMNDANVIYFFLLGGFCALGTGIIDLVRDIMKVSFDTPLSLFGGTVMIITYTVFLIQNYKSLDVRVTQYMEEIEQQNKVLETKVNKRTKELQETLAELKRTQAEFINQERLAALGNLVSGIAHEINTPVGVAITASSHLNDNVKKTLEMFNKDELKRSEFAKFMDTTFETSQIILVNLENAAELILSFKKVSADQLSEFKELVNLREYINKIITTLRPQLKKYRHQIEIICSDDLKIHTYPGVLSQIFTNLIMNSLIHAYTKDSDCYMLIEATQTENNLWLRYADKGKGIEEAYINRIFEPFFTTNRENGGTGLGLNIVYNLITEKLKGTIICSSKIGEGVNFIINIPIRS